MPGHGEALDAARAPAILREDLDYLRALPDADAAARPPDRRAAAIHAENVERVA